MGEVSPRIIEMRHCKNCFKYRGFNDKNWWVRHSPGDCSDCDLIWKYISKYIAQRKGVKGRSYARLLKEGSWRIRIFNNPEEKPPKG